jgi:DNA-binding NarL/FixJ family response regulator
LTVSKGTLTVAIVDDNRLVREALAGLLSALPDFRVVASPSADAAFLQTSRPDVLLLDVGLGEDDSMRVAAAVRTQCPATRIIAMDLLPEHDEIVEFVSAGVSGFVTKDATFEDLVATIRAVAGGATVLPPRPAPSLLARIASDAAARTGQHVPHEVRLTPREREVIDLISEGLSNKEIAARLGVASHTVKSHVRNVMEKLALHTRLQIAAYSRREDAL